VDILVQFLEAQPKAGQRGEAYAHARQVSGPCPPIVDRAKGRCGSPCHSHDSPSSEGETVTASGPPPKGTATALSSVRPMVLTRTKRKVSAGRRHGCTLEHHLDRHSRQVSTSELLRSGRNVGRELLGPQE
jgi:hypothetical protein